MLKLDFLLYLTMVRCSVWEIKLNGRLYKIRVPPIVCRHGPGYSGTNMRYLAISIPQVRWIDRKSRGWPWYVYLPNNTDATKFFDRCSSNSIIHRSCFCLCEDDYGSRASSYACCWPKSVFASKASPFPCHLNSIDRLSNKYLFVTKFI